MKYQYYLKLKMADEINLYKILSIAHHSTMASSHLARKECVFRTVFVLRFKAILQHQLFYSIRF